MGKATRDADGEQDSGSEGDAPEQVSLSSGREAANKLRKEERENRRRVQAEAKQRRLKNIVQKKKVEVLSDEQAVAPASNLVEADGIPTQNDQGKEHREPVGTDLLDDSVVQFLVAQEKKSMEAITSTQENKPQKRKRKVSAKQKGREVDNSSRRVKVVLLEPDVPTLANFQSALEFKRNRLYGEGITRSLCMLPKPRAV